MSKKKNKFTLQHVMHEFLKEVVNDYALRAYHESKGWTSLYTAKTVEDVYEEIIAKMTVALRWFDRDFGEKEELPF